MMHGELNPDILARTLQRIFQARPENAGREVKVEVIRKEEYEKRKSAKEGTA